jgi:phosphate transport system substrate-binding protein
MDLRGIHDGTYTDWTQITGYQGPSLPIRIVGRGQGSGTRKLFERSVLGTGEGELTSDECRDEDRGNPQARIIRCERENNSGILHKIGTIPGAIGCADAPSIAQARRTSDLTVLSLNGRSFEFPTTTESSYPFWTVEYLYVKTKPEPGSLAANFIKFVRQHEHAHVRLAETGFRPCLATQGPLELCNLR